MTIVNNGITQIDEHFKRAGNLGNRGNSKITSGGDLAIDLVIANQLLTDLTGCQNPVLAHQV